MAELRSAFGVGSCTPNISSDDIDDLIAATGAEEALVAEVLAGAVDALVADILNDIPVEVTDDDLDGLLAEVQTPVVDDADLDAMLASAVVTDDDLDALLADTKPRKCGTGPNATAKFLDKRLHATGGYNGTLMRTMRTAVSSRLHVSHTVGMVDDHIHNCFARLIARDSLADRLAEGHVITDQQLAMFAVRSGYTDVRDSGTNPVCRELYGARTDREREKGVVTAPMTDPRIVWGSDEDGNTGTWVDLADEAANQEDAVAFAEVWDRLEGIIRKHKPLAAERYIGLLRSKANGASVADIADDEDVSVSRATSMMAEIRRVLREGDLDDLGLHLSNG